MLYNMYISCYVFDLLHSQNFIMASFHDNLKYHCLQKNKVGQKVLAVVEKVIDRQEILIQEIISEAQACLCRL